VLALVPGNGGIVMATFVPFFVAPPAARWLRDALEAARADDTGGVDQFKAMREHARSVPPPRATVDDVVRHFEYLREAVGIAHIGVGGDFDGSDFVTLGLEDVASYPRLFDALRARRWSSADLAAVASGNVPRVMRDVESVAGGL
jgi:membrane dipeptidase